MRRDPHSGEPNGVLEESAMVGVEGLLVPGLLDGLRILRRANRLYLAAGVTTAQSGSTSASLMRMSLPGSIAMTRCSKARYRQRSSVSQNVPRCP